MKKINRKNFPIIMFFALLTAEIIISLTVIGINFYNTARDVISDLEFSSKNYSTAMIETFSEIAELSAKNGDYSRMNILFAQKSNQNDIREIFYVLSSGAIMAHSSADTSARLKGNISSDDIYYRQSEIFRPVKDGSREVLALDYNISGTALPFSGSEKDFIARYFYSGIESTGTLTVKAVFSEGKPIGAVGIIAGKERIYSFLTRHIGEIKKASIYSLAGSMIFAFIISCFVYLRLRRLEKSNIEYMSQFIDFHTLYEEDAETGAEQKPVPARKAAVPEIPPAEPAAKHTEKAASIPPPPPEKKPVAVEKAITAPAAAPPVKEEKAQRESVIVIAPEKLQVLEDYDASGAAVLPEESAMGAEKKNRDSVHSDLITVELLGDIDSAGDSDEIIAVPVENSKSKGAAVRREILDAIPLEGGK